MAQNRKASVIPPVRGQRTAPQTDSYVVQCFSNVHQNSPDRSSSVGNGSFGSKESPLSGGGEAAGGTPAGWTSQLLRLKNDDTALDLIVKVLPFAMAVSLEELATYCCLGVACGDGTKNESYPLLFPPPQWNRQRPTSPSDGRSAERRRSTGYSFSSEGGASFSTHTSGQGTASFVSGTSGHPIQLPPLRTQPGMRFPFMVYFTLSQDALVPLLDTDGVGSDQARSAASLSRSAGISFGALHHRPPDAGMHLSVTAPGAAPGSGRPPPSPQPLKPGVGDRTRGGLRGHSPLLPTLEQKGAEEGEPQEPSKEEVTTPMTRAQRREAEKKSRKLAKKHREELEAKRSEALKLRELESKAKENESRMHAQERECERREVQLESYKRALESDKRRKSFAAEMAAQKKELHRGNQQAFEKAREEYLAKKHKELHKLRLEGQSKHTTLIRPPEHRGEELSQYVSSTADSSLGYPSYLPSVRSATSTPPSTDVATAGERTATLTGEGKLQHLLSQLDTTTQQDKLEADQLHAKEVDRTKNRDVETLYKHVMEQGVDKRRALKVQLRRTIVEQELSQIRCEQVAKGSVETEVAEKEAEEARRLQEYYAKREEINANAQRIAEEQAAYEEAVARQVAAMQKPVFEPAVEPDIWQL